VNASYQWLDCDNNFAVIQGETSQNYTATANGSYAVELTENGCVDTSACVTISTVGIKENAFTTNFSAYPNPTTGQLKISLGKEMESINVTVRNYVGQEMFRRTYTNTEEIDLMLEGATGVYYVEVIQNDMKKVLKVVKK
jgi:hypothetical protein